MVFLMGFLWFSYGFSMVFLCFSYHVPMFFLSCSYVVHIIFLWFSYGKSEMSPRRSEVRVLTSAVKIARINTWLSPEVLPYWQAPDGRWLYLVNGNPWWPINPWFIDRGGYHFSSQSDHFFVIYPQKNKPWVDESWVAMISAWWWLEHAFPYVRE